MSALTEQQTKQVTDLIGACETRLRADINNIISGEGVLIKQEIMGHREEITKNRAALADQDQRTSAILVDQNNKTQEIIEEFAKHRAEMFAQANTITAQQKTQQSIFDGTQDLDTRLTSLDTQVRQLGIDAKAAIDQVDSDRLKLVGEVRDLSINAKAAIDKVDLERKGLFDACDREFKGIQEQINLWFVSTKQSQDGPSGLGGFGSRGGMASKLDKKEISVSKLPEDVDNATFRQWIDSIDLSLEITHGWKLPNLLLNHVRRAKVAVDAEVLANCITKANEDFFKMQREMKIEPKDGDDIDQVLDYPFHERTTYLNAYLVSKLNSNLHDKTAGVEHRNGFELYRQVCQIVDAVPENASFHMKNEITGLTKTYGPKVTDLKSLYGFRLLLKKRMVEFKKIIGEEFSTEQAQLILWNVLDSRSKEIAMTEKLDTKSFRELYEHIDLRYKIQFGHLNYSSSSKDDPMGLALLGAPREFFEPPTPEHEAGQLAAAGTGVEGQQHEGSGHDLDAMGKGGKGKGGACHCCGGEGHFARDCPSTQPIGPQSTECHGCGGRGHIKQVCPTAHPELKVMKGKGKGAGGSWQGKGGWQTQGSYSKGAGKSKGKGYGGWKGKGKGKGGKGVSTLDLIGHEQWGNDWSGQ
jgi:hypothetical protein